MGSEGWTIGHAIVGSMVVMGSEGYGRPRSALGPVGICRRFPAPWWGKVDGVVNMPIPGMPGPPGGARESCSYQYSESTPCGGIHEPFLYDSQLACAYWFGHCPCGFDKLVKPLVLGVFKEEG